MGRIVRPRQRPRPGDKGGMPQTGDPPFDSEAHFKDYDHKAVRELSRKTLICPATWNRKATVEVCLAVTNKHKLDAKVYIHDDGSTAYDAEWLQQFADRVFVHPHSVGARKGVKNLRSNIVKSILGDYELETFQPWLKEDFGEKGPEYLYMVDSDAYHDPFFFYRLHEIMTKYPDQWGMICLYNAKFHARSNHILDYHTTLRSVGAGISLFFNLEDFKKNRSKVQVPDSRGWDGFYCIEIGGRQIITSLVSYVEHFGKWGFHNKKNWDRDQALNPTKFLKNIRTETINQIEAEQARKKK